MKGTTWVTSVETRDLRSETSACAAKQRLSQTFGF